MEPSDDVSDPGRQAQCAVGVEKWVELLPHSSKSPTRDTVKRWNEIFSSLAISPYPVTADRLVIFCLGCSAGPLRNRLLLVAPTLKPRMGTLRSSSVETHVRRARKLQEITDPHFPQADMSWALHEKRWMYLRRDILHAYACVPDSPPRRANSAQSHRLGEPGERRSRCSARSRTGGPRASRRPDDQECSSAEAADGAAQAATRRRTAQARAQAPYACVHRLCDTSPCDHCDAPGAERLFAPRYAWLTSCCLTMLIGGQLWLDRNGARRLSARGSMPEVDAPRRLIAAALSVGTKSLTRSGFPITPSPPSV